MLGANGLRTHVRSRFVGTPFLSGSAEGVRMATTTTWTKASIAYQHLAEVAAAVSPTNLGYVGPTRGLPSPPTKVVPQSILLREVDDAVSFAAAARATVPIVPLPDPRAAAGRRRDLLAASFGVDAHSTEFESGYGLSALQVCGCRARLGDIWRRGRTTSLTDRNTPFQIAHRRRRRSLAATQRTCSSATTRQRTPRRKSRWTVCSQAAKVVGRRKAVARRVRARPRRHQKHARQRQLPSRGDGASGSGRRR